MADPKKRKFFDERGRLRSNPNVTAADFVDQSAGSGFAVDAKTGLVHVDGNADLGARYRAWQQRVAVAQTPETAYNKLLRDQRAKLKKHLYEHYDKYRTAITAKPSAKGGTALVISGLRDAWGRPARYRGRDLPKESLRLARSSRPGLTVKDFLGEDMGSTFAPGLEEDLLRDNFDRFYEAVFHGTAVTAPTPEEQKAVDYLETLKEATAIQEGADSVQ